MFNKVFLQGNKSKISVNKKQSLAINLVGSERLLPQFGMYGNVNLIELYNDERYNCNTIRLNCIIKPYCSNVLFNPFTEIVQNEGSTSAYCLNFQTELPKNVQKLYYKDRTTFDSSSSIVLSHKAIDDTQLSSVNCGNFVYHCGLDFLQNHILRNQTFKTVNVLKGKNDTDEFFNTLSDYHRHYDGTIVSGDTIIVGDRNFKNNSTPYKMHLYEADDVLTFKNAYKTLVKEDNGWFGFTNRGKIKIYDPHNGELLDISKPLNNRESCEFIDFYPSRDLFYFTPKYNSFRHRIEKNWNYLLTYPSSIHRDYDNVTIPFINDNIKGGALRLFLVDDTLDYSINLYSMSKHGLREGDYINIYKDTEIAISNARVIKVYNEYDFSITKNGFTLDNYYDADATNERVEVSGTTTYKFKKDDLFYYSTNTDFMTFSFKKLKNGHEVDYYVKVLSRMPNWKFADKKVTEKIIYEDDNTFLKRNQIYAQNDRNNGDTNVFESHISKLAFSKTIYNDDVSEIIFTDDINIDYLHDHLKRPLTDIYLTIIKNNKGKDEWYNGITSANTIEFSHCFDIVTSGFYLNDKMYDINLISGSPVSMCDAKTLCHSGNTFSGLNTNLINDIEYRSNETDGGDAIDYYRNMNFYGDLCSYCHETCEEETIQNVEYRFNTYQRENNSGKSINYEDIYKDDYDTNSFSDNFTLGKRLPINQLYEGYYYNPNYKIPIRTVSSELEEQTPKIFTIKNIRTSQNNQFVVNTLENNYFEENDAFVLYKKYKKDSDDETVNKTDTYYKCKIIKINSLKEFEFKLIDNIKLEDFNNENKYYYKIIKPDITIPDYAELLTDGSCTYVWRYIIQNGFDNNSNSNVEVYPFTNNALYVMKEINFYLKRQNPNNTSILTNKVYDFYNIKGKYKENESENNFVSERNMLC